jgi:glutaminyl-tRNA synthetase
MNDPVSPADASPEAVDFIREIVINDQKTGKHEGRVQTRFPPEPNGYLHIGHAKAICLDFGVAGEFGGKCNLRMDDTNPAKEDMEYAKSIMDDVSWLGFTWDALFFASDYYETICERAEFLIRKGKAYVCDLTGEQMSEHRGNLTEPGRHSPYRDRSVEENLDLFRRMRAGEFADGTRILRAKIDMAHPNMHMRDPVMYRIMREHHYRTGDTWCIYPMYDYAHPISDALEGITHSLCTLEFEIHRPLYDWFVKECEMEHTPRQIEFSRLNITYTVMSKRKLLELFKEGLVNGWDDPRMPTICGLRRRGYTPEAIRAFCSKIGVTKYNSLTNIALLEHCLRDDLNKRAHRVMAVLDPIKVVIENYPRASPSR